MMLDLEERFTHAWAGEPAHRPVRERVVAGRRAVRRRRIAGGAGALALAAVGGVAVAGIGGSAPVPATDRGSDPVAGVRVDEAPVPVKPWPYADQTGGSSPPVWADEDGRIYRSAEDVRVVEQAVATPIVDLDGARVGEVVAIWTRWRGEDEVQSFGTVRGRGFGSMSTVGRLRGEATWEATLAELRSMPHVAVGDPSVGLEVARHPVGIAADGTIELRLPGASLTQQGTASAWSRERFDAAPPDAAVVSWLGYRYFALVGYLADGKDVIVVEPAGPEGLDSWLRDVRRRMDAGQALG